jgi:hypothetical protein
MQTGKLYFVAKNYWLLCPSYEAVLYSLSWASLTQPSTMVFAHENAAAAYAMAKGCTVWSLRHGVYSVVPAGSMVVFLEEKASRRGHHKVLTGEGMVGWIVCPPGVSMRSCFQLQRSTGYASW